MGQRHKHADIIHAWAEGEEIQYKHPLDKTWCDVERPVWDSSIEYRKKPYSCIYRLYLYKSPIGGSPVLGLYKKDPLYLEEKILEKEPYFIKWVTNWQEYVDE